MTSQEIPLTKVLHPTLQNFTNFQEFVESLDHDPALQDYGMIKIIPPSRWKPRKTSVTTLFDKLTVSSPIEQNVQGTAGVYELFLIQKKSMKINDYKKKVEAFDSYTDNKSIEEVEDLFWKSIAFSPPFYGADIGGNCLFDSGVPWNLSELPGLLKDGLESSISGVNTPYLYIGSWKALFGWHKEDLDLYAVNYNHYGKPKLWYCIPPSEGKRLEDFAKNYFQEGFRKCKEFFRHKTVMINPYLLKQKIPDLKIHKVVQYPGEFIVTFGGAYHAGFNWGFNIAEAVNFATMRWLRILPNVGVCRCVNDSVKIHYKEFFRALLNSKTYPKYGNLPSIKKICSEYGVTKTGAKMEEEVIVKASPTKGKRSTSKRGRSPKKVDDEENGESEEESPSQVKGRKGKRTESSDKKKPKATVAVRKSYYTKGNAKIPVAKIKAKVAKDVGEKSTSKISTRSKKIKKVDEEFVEIDWRNASRTRRSSSRQSSSQGRKEGEKDAKDIKQLVKRQKFDDLIFEDWVQCDKCNKWRIIKTGEGDKLLRKKKLVCSNIPGRNCSQPEDKPAKDSYILPKNQEVIV